ncbi:9278_t:CDS:2 [Funneliformis geosporum]|uniref:mRNA m(6)A methyltransferase n=1 Tax=Funneliformis geosporum TaxID=1117311 RepID=A0A9W4WVS1_9GLOM|nr:9278_t:CDS:2 [Funneliformis geosporum]CAI2189398.1 4289_t:CDS:2 [Funneliformis geosporum]
MSKNEKSPLINVVDDTCFTYSCGVDCTTNHSNNVSKDSTLEAGLKTLLDRETELKLQIDELIEEITNLEAIARNRSKSNGGNEEENKETKRNGIKKEVVEEVCWEEFEAPEWCVPIKADVLTFEWDELAKECQFDQQMNDRLKVAIAYQQLPDVCIEELPIPQLQKNGFLFIWVINNKYSKAFDMMKKWGYTYCDDITWVKQTVNRRMAKGHGFYLQHAKETCLMGRKGEDPPECNHSISSDVIFSERRGQSQKPEELYEMIEELVPNGNYLEIFGRKNNLRDYWVTIGNEL